MRTRRRRVRRHSRDGIDTNRSVREGWFHSLTGREQSRTTLGDRGTASTARSGRAARHEPAGIAKWVRAGGCTRVPRRLRLRAPRALSEGRVDGGGSRRRRTAPRSPGRRAAALLGVTRGVPDEIDVLVADAAHVQPGSACGRAATSTRATSPSSTRIPVTTVARLLVDLTDDHGRRRPRVPHPRGRVWAIVQPRATRAAMARANGAADLKVLEEALRLHLSGSAGSRSRLEKRFRRLVVGAGLPAPRQNVRINGFEVDALLARTVRRDRRRRDTGGRARRSTTGSATRRCAPPGTSSSGSPRTTSTSGRRRS